MFDRYLSTDGGRSVLLSTFFPRSEAPGILRAVSPFLGLRVLAALKSMDSWAISPPSLLQVSPLWSQGLLVELPLLPSSLAEQLESSQEAPRPAEAAREASPEQAGGDREASGWAHTRPSSRLERGHQHTLTQGPVVPGTVRAAAFETQAPAPGPGPFSPCSG